MTEGLGYARFAVAGSDIGLGIATRMALEYPQSVSAIHLCGAASPPAARRGEPYTADERRFLAAQTQWHPRKARMRRYNRRGRRRWLSRSPIRPSGSRVGFSKKFHAWSDLRGSTVLDAFGDALLDTLTIYWATETIGSSMRLYYESARWPKSLLPTDRVRVPTSVFVLPKDLEQPPREWAERLYDVTRYTVAERGGHFPALEIPHAYVDELRAAFRGV